MGRVPCVNSFRTVAAALLLGAVTLTPAAVASESEPVDLGGESVSGGTSASDPTEVEAGVWSDTLEPGETTRHFSYRRTTDFSAVHVGLVATNAQDIDTVTLTGTTPDGDSCDTESSSGPNTANHSFGAQIAFIGSGPEDRNDECLTADVVHFSVGHTGDEAEVPFAITVIEELPTDSGSTADLPTAPSTEPAYQAPDVDGSAEDVTGGTSFDDAPVIKDGVWSDTIQSGDELLYAVDDVDWGQTVSVRVTTPELSAEDEEKGGYTKTLGVSLIDPLRSWVSAEPEGATASGSLSEDEPVELTAAAGPVRYLDRFGDSWMYLPGRHWVSLRMTGSDGSQPLKVPVEIEVEVQGEPSGQPTYDGDGADEPFLVAEDSWTETASGDGGGTSWVRLIMAGVLALVGAVCIGAGTLRLRRG